MSLFAIATFSPVFLILAAAGFGGVWSWLAFAALTFLAFSLDRLTPEQIVNQDPQAEFPASGPLLIALAVAHLAVLPVVVWSIATTSHPLLERVLTGVATALFFGQVSHPVAHELIHRPSRKLRWLGQLLYTSMFFGHHASAHLRVHHVHVGSPFDPNSALAGENFYRFAIRAWPAGFIAGLKAENRLRRDRAMWRHPYFSYLFGAAMILAGTVLIGGEWAAFSLVLINGYAQLQILMSDYVQHYGLSRHVMADGRLEPVGPQHSWNAPHWFTAAISVNASRHSDHHVQPSRPFPVLQLDEEKMPCLPYSIPIMAGIALVPPLWRRVMDPRCARWSTSWMDRANREARDFPPAILTRAKPAGGPSDLLPNSAHAYYSPDPLYGGQRRRRRPDDGR